jgi:hypothetical protein
MTPANHSTPEGLRSPAGRVLLALETSEPAQELLAAATELARGLHIELAGLFVEDAALLRMAALPFTREVGLVSGLVRPIETRDLERTLQRQAEQVRHGLAKIAAELALPWSFQVARGSLLEQALEAAAEADLIVLGRRRSAANRAGGETSQPARSPIVSAFFDASEAAQRVLSAALELAQGRPEQLSLLVPAGSVATLESLRERAAAVLRVPAGLPRLQPIGAPEAGELAQQTRRLRSRALVLSMRSLQDAHTQMRVLLEVAGCPVVLVR